MLPGINGYRICATLREEGIWTPILMLTAKDGEFDEAEALDTGADDYVTKPFSYVVLVAQAAGLDPARCRRATGGARGRRPALRSRVASDLAGRDAGGAHGARDGAARVPAAAPRARSSSKTEILDHVWDYDFEGDPNIVEVYIAAPAQQARPPVRAPRDRDRAGRRLPVGRRWRLASPPHAARRGRHPRADHGHRRGRRRRRAWRSPRSLWSSTCEGRSASSVRTEARLRARVGRARASPARCRRSRPVRSTRSSSRSCDDDGTVLDVEPERRAASPPRHARPRARNGSSDRCRSRTARSWWSAAPATRAGREVTVIVGRSLETVVGGDRGDGRRPGRRRSRCCLLVVGARDVAHGRAVARHRSRRSAARSMRSRAPSCTAASPTRRAAMRSRGSRRR